MNTVYHRLLPGQSCSQLNLLVECVEECPICDTVKRFDLLMTEEPVDTPTKRVYNPPIPR
jgi:hypothetical protein